MDGAVRARRHGRGAGAVLGRRVRSRRAVAPKGRGVGRDPRRALDAGGICAVTCADRLSLGARRLFVDRHAGHADRLRARAARAGIPDGAGGAVGRRACRWSGAFSPWRSSRGFGATGRRVWRRPLPERAEPLVVRLVQPNAAQELKWRPDMQQVFFDRLLASTRAVSDPVPDVTIWPEAAVPLRSGIRRRPPGRGGGGRRSRHRAHPRHPSARRDARAGGMVQLARGSARGRTGGGGLRQASSGAVRRVHPGRGRDRAAGSAGAHDADARRVHGGTGGRIWSRRRGLPPFLPLICYEAIFPHLHDRAGRTRGMDRPRDQ